MLSDMFAGPGAARATAREVDWSATALGPPEQWPSSLRTTVATMLGSRHPMFLWWGPELIQLYNDAYLPSFGQGKHPNAMGQRGADCWQEIWPIIFPQIDDVVARSKASWNEDQLVPIHRNGRIEEVYWTYGYSPVLDESGAVGGVLVVCTETTSGVLARRRLETMRDLATALLEAEDASQVAAITADHLSRARADVPFAIVEVDGVDTLRMGIDRTLNSRKDPVSARRALEESVVCEPWQEPVTECVVLPFPGSNGTITFGLSPRLPFDDAYESFLHQVVEQVRSALSRVAIDLERRRLLSQAPVAAALLTGPEHVYQIANARYVEMVGREVLGKRYVDAFPEVRGTELLRAVEGVYRGGQPFAAEEMLVRLARTPGGELEDRFFNFTLEPIRDVRGAVYGMMVVAIDITAQVLARRAAERSHAERAELLAAAQVAARAKDEFLALLGHELRNPLAPIVTALDIIKLKNVPGIERERDIIARQASNLVRLVDDLLDVSRVAEGKIELKKQRVSLDSVVRAAVEMVGPLFEKRRHHLHVDVPSGLDLNADPVRIGQVVTNLLTNAARYTEPGGEIRVRAERLDHEVCLRVIDNGIGISKEAAPHLFERFFQASRRVGAHGGLGLGLALVKGFVELHGGTVRVESAGLGQGSTFELRLPLLDAGVKAERSAPPRQSPTPRSSKERVLLVDDNEDIVDLFRTVLDRSGFDVETAHDGPTALRVAADFHPTVAVLDLGLPVMDGYELAAKLVEQLGEKAPRLIAMSGYGDETDDARFAGFERHLTKPVDADTLLHAIATHR